MAFVEVARFWDVREAQIARSALEASGISTFLPDEYRAQALWTEQNAIGGIRLCVSEADVEAAHTFLIAVRNSASSPKSKATVQSVAIGAGLGLASMILGWPLLGFKQGKLWQRIVATIWVALILFVIIAGIIRQYLPV